MSFLFKSKKSAPQSALPTASRNIHTSDGTPSAPPNGISEKPGERSTQSPPPVGGPNGSISPMGATAINAPNGQFARRERSESEAGTRPTNVSGQGPNAALYPWSQKRLALQNIQSNPFPRYGSAINAVASKEGDIYMMGGLINGSVVKGDLWIVESGTSNLSCYPIATVSEGPGPRVGHAALLVGNAFIVFGGDTKMDDSDVLDDTLYLLNTSSRQWSRASPPGPKPSGRYGHTLNILGSKIYIFGGQVEGYFFNDLIAFDLNALQNPVNQWEFLIKNTGEGEQHSGPVPQARTNHTIISHNDQLILFGGTNGTQWFNDVWTYDPRSNAWTQQDCIGYIPAPREGHSAALVNDVMYVFGGRTEEGNDLGDLAAFRISSKRWYTFQNMGPSPSPRSGHSMTAFGKQVVVMAGEPSSAPRDHGELSMVYILDTGKIRYPNDAPTPTQALDARQPSSPTRRPSLEARSASRNAGNVRDVMSGGPVQKLDSSPVTASPASRLPRAAQGPSGPPSQGQARGNGVASPANGIKGRQVESRGPMSAPDRATDTPIQNPTVREIQKENSRPSRDGSPGTHGRRTPTQQVVSKAKAMEAGEAAPMISSGVARQRSLRSQRGHGSIDSTEDGALGRSNSAKFDEKSSLKSFGDGPRSPKLNPHQEALVKELEVAKRNNAWYASELAIARKAGYHPTNSSSPTFDDRALSAVSDDDRPLMEAFLTMRGELLKMQQAMEHQATSTAKKIAEVEHQRDAAITEAAYARAKLAAHGGSQRSTPQPDGSREVDEMERTTDISRRLALSLAAQSEHKSRVDSLLGELRAERRARELAEESADAAQRQLEEISNGRNPVELEGLRAELHEAQGNMRSEASMRAEAEEKLRMLNVEHGNLRQMHEESSSRLTNHMTSMSALEAAVAASTSKSSLMEKQIEEEREKREIAERKLAQLKSEHEERTNELEHTSKRLRDAEDLAEVHAKEATTHRAALLAGLANLSASDPDEKYDALAEQKMAALKESAERATALAKQNQDAADLAAQKLRGAEERIAGLEAYQEQSSREGLQLRRQLQSALKDTQNHQSEIRDLRNHLESHQRDASALTVQYSALKGLLGERGVSMSDTRRSPVLEHSSGSRHGTPEQTRVRDLEQQLQASMKAHDDTKTAFETRMQEADGTYREKLEQLENDYQSAVHYVKGTEKMLRKMREELTKYKTQNQQLQADIESTRGNVAEAGKDGATWASERDAMQSSIEKIKSQMNSQISAMESDLASVQEQLAIAQAERDQQKAHHEELFRSAEQGKEELEELKSENAMLQSRAEEAERRVTKLLDHLGNSVGNYRRQSQMHTGPSPLANGNHNRDTSISTTTDDESEEGFTRDERSSVALDHLASELQALKSQWESNSRNNFRLSKEFDFERTPTRESSGVEFGESFADWRKKHDDQGVKAIHAGSST